MKLKTLQLKRKRSPINFISESKMLKIAYLIDPSQVSSDTLVHVYTVEATFGSILFEHILLGTIKVKSFLENRNPFTSAIPTT